MSAVTPPRVLGEVVHPAMDSRVHNLDQARLLARLDTPECDSLIERIRSIRDRPVPFRPGAYIVEDDEIDLLEDDVWHLVESNGREGQFQRLVAGNGEQIARDLRPLNSPEGRRLSCKRPEIRRMVGPILDVIADADLADPCRRWDALARTLQQLYPRETLLSRWTLHELGSRRARTLVHLLGEDGSR